MAGDVEGFSSSIHDTSVSAGFRTLYEEGLLFDVTLVIEDHQFQAHKALLATQSDYFRIMFTADMRERDQNKIHLKGLTATGFSHVLQFMYYGTIELSMTTVHEILQAAMYVQLIEVVKFCCSFLLAKICLENCAEIMRLLDDFGVNIEGVREKLDSFLLENFVPLMARPDFLSYLSFEKLMTYLDNDHLSRFPEIELYEAVQAWLRHDRRRWRHTDTIIQNIRFCLMTPSSVFEKVKTSEFYRYSRQLRREVEQAMNYFHSVHQQPLMEMKSNRIRSAKPQTAVFRGMIGHSMVGKSWGQTVNFMLPPKCSDMTQDKILGYEWQTCLYHAQNLLLVLLEGTSMQWLGGQEMRHFIQLSDMISQKISGNLWIPIQSISMDMKELFLVTSCTSLVE
ncbi:kelch-like protein 15 isoform X2 [Elgaria multicarinata webbii]|uniref:kelch-like protein 15 isoform X2 n=1 Tax=Elgaria multicarinata webbii TaxID=159646 RepID=UPI002FCD43AB